MVHRYAVEIEFESYAASGRQAIEFALNSLLGDGMPSKIRAYVNRLTEGDGVPLLTSRGGVYMVNLAVGRDQDGEREVQATVAKRPIRGTNAC